MNIEVLEREHGAAVVDHLSQALHMPAVTLDEHGRRRGGVRPRALRRSDAPRAAWRCAMPRAACRIVLGDPFDLDTQDWLEERLAVPFRYRIAHRQDVAA